LNFFGRPGERHHELGTVVKLNQKELVLGLAVLKNSAAARRDSFNFLPMERCIEDQSNGKRSVEAGEIRDILLDFVFEKTKVLFVHSGHKLVQGWSR